MQIEYLPLLRVMREVYETPRGMERFRRYLETALGGTDDITMPVLSFNPMAEEHVIEKLDQLIALGAEEAGAEAAREAQERLHDLPGSFKTGLELGDDVAGGWTNRYTTEASYIFSGRGRVNRPFATALLFVSETPAREQIRGLVMAAVYRHVYQRDIGLPRTLQDVLRQEGLAAVFAGVTPVMPAADVAATRERMAAFVDSAAYPEIFACLYGDKGAAAVGYPPLGFLPRAGFAVALVEAREREQDPVGVLLRRSPHEGGHGRPSSKGGCDAI